jgi:hypothetical protein
MPADPTLRQHRPFFAIALGIAVAVAASGCTAFAPPQPWEKGLLARPSMAMTPDPLDQRNTLHTYTSKENASGGHGVGGGGCGCN